MEATVQSRAIMSEDNLISYYFKPLPNVLSGWGVIWLVTAVSFSSFGLQLAREQVTLSLGVVPQYGC